MEYEIFNQFDFNIIHSVNNYAQKSELIDRAIHILTNNQLLKGGVIMTMLWWLWFRRQRGLIDRQRILVTLISSVLAIAVARFLALTLPMRLRPIHNVDINFILPISVKSTLLDGWSAFPSDHAVLFFVFAASFFFIHRLAGIFAAIYVTVFICLPRLYVGLHHPTDLIAGTLIGILIAVLFQTLLFPTALMRKVIGWEESHPEFFYPVLFLFTFQVAQLFDSARQLASFAATIAKRILF